MNNRFPISTDYQQNMPSYTLYYVLPIHFAFSLSWFNYYELQLYAEVEYFRPIRLPLSGANDPLSVLLFVVGLFRHPSAVDMNCTPQFFLCIRFIFSLARHCSDLISKHPAHCLYGMYAQNFWWNRIFAAFPMKS